MPKQFDACVKTGGRVRTVKGAEFGMKKKGQYRRICYKSGRSSLGHIKTKKN